MHELSLIVAKNFHVVIENWLYMGIRYMSSVLQSTTWTIASVEIEVDLNEFPLSCMHVHALARGSWSILTFLKEALVANMRQNLRGPFIYCSLPVAWLHYLSGCH